MMLSLRQRRRQAFASEFKTEEGTERMNALNPAEAIRDGREAQRAYCHREGKPMFVGDGWCPYCFSNVFLGMRGYSVEQAGSQLITRCPHCGFSFCE